MNEVKSFLSYIEFEKRYSPHTLLSYSNDIDQFSSFCQRTFDEPNILNANHTYIRSWMVSLLEAGDKASTINRKVSSLKSLYKYLLKRKLIDSNPTARLTRPKTPKRLPTFIDEKATVGLMEQINENIEEMEGYRNMVMMEIFYTTGLRRSELMNLTPASIDSHKLQIKVMGKGGKERIIPISHDLLQKMETLLEFNRQLDCSDKEDYLFLTIKGKKVYPELIYSIIKKQLSHVTTLQKRSPHVMRHTFATHLLNNGADLNAIKDLMGHSSLASTQVYTHNSIEKLKNIYKQAHPKA